MTLSIPSTVVVFEEKPNHYLQPATTIEQESSKLKRGELVRLATLIDTRSWFSLEDGQPHLKDYSEKIKSTGFSLNNPWLPPNAYKFLNKLKRGPITEKESLELMELVAERACEHFQLGKGKFVAMTLRGQVVEVSDTRIDLLKRIQGQKYREQIFLWRVGFDSFSGRI